MNDLDQVIAKMYEGVCFEPGQRPDWNVEDEIFAPGARMVRINDEAAADPVRDVDRFYEQGYSLVSSREAQKRVVHGIEPHVVSFLALEAEGRAVKLLRCGGIGGVETGEGDSGDGWARGLLGECRK